MRRWLVILAILILAVAGFEFFYLTGGRGLVRIIRPYLMEGIPDKRYGWSDFSSNNDTKRVSGFYSPQLSGSNGVAIWTLGGIKRFYHAPGVSVYYHRDVCSAIRQIKGPTSMDGQTGGGVTGKSVEITYFDVAQWREEMKPEYFVTIQWVDKEGKRVVDKLWSVSGKYRILGQVGGKVCE